MNEQLLKELIASLSYIASSTEDCHTAREINNIVDNLEALKLKLEQY